MLKQTGSNDLLWGKFSKIKNVSYSNTNYFINIMNLLGCQLIKKVFRMFSTKIFGGKK
jgi:hypothetical protein